MSDPCIICVAITGSLPTKADNPAVPVTIAEQVLYLATGERRTPAKNRNTEGG